MIDVQAVIQNVPHFETFCSVAKLNELVERLRENSRFEVSLLGESVGGWPIHHVRFGRGSVKALFVAFPHCKEPIGGLTVFSLLTLLLQGQRQLCEADVEWHVVPCIDPDGAVLNEGWTQKPLTMDHYMRNFYVQPLTDQVDGSFPIRHKRLKWDRPSCIAGLLQSLLDRVRPDFFYSLHNAWTGGAFYHVSRDIGREHYERLYALLEQQRFPLQRRPMWRGVCAQFSEGVVDTWTIRKHYDYLEKTIHAPEEVLRFGSSSWDYLEQIKPDALTFVTEMGYVRHLADESERETAENLRRFKLRVDADSKYLGTLLLEEWERVKGEVDRSNPIYAGILGGAVVPDRPALVDGGRPMAMQPTQDVLFNPQHDRVMKEGDRFQACMVEGGFWFLCQSYQFVRLLKASAQTPAIGKAIERCDAAFDQALAEIQRYVDFDAFEIIPCDTLARVQLGSGLIAVNSLLDRPRRLREKPA
jgi:hypothetical protein